MKERVEVFWFSEQPCGHFSDEVVEQHKSRRLNFSNTYFDSQKAHVLYNQYHEQYSWADQVGFEGIKTNEHNLSYWCMKPAANLDAVVITNVTRGPG